MKFLFIIFGAIFCISSNANQCLTNITKRIEKNTKNSPAAGVIVIKDGKTIYKKSLGFVDVEKKIKATNSTPFSLCSLSKQFTAAAILQLEELGLLSIEDKISKYIDWLPGYANDIKIENLIYHNSGIPCFNNNNQEFKNLRPEEMFKKNIKIDNEYAKNYIINNKQLFQTGKNGLIVMQITGFLGKLLKKFQEKNIKISCKKIFLTKLMRKILI